MAICPTCQGNFEHATFCPRDGTKLEVAVDVGAHLGGRYRLIRKVGEGSMGIVFEAEHVSIRRRVAVKLLHRRLVASAEMVERLRREAQVTSGLGHPNIVDCLDFGTEDGQVYLAMEWLDGETLEHRSARARMDVDTILDIAGQTASGLAEAHARGVVHRDLKPANLFLTHDRAGALRVKILDFGIAKLAAEQTQLTSTGVLVGTPNYMAPEQALGDAVDARADIYALGVILYELVAGRVPFQGETPLAVLHQHTAKMPALPSTLAAPTDLADELDTLIMRCLAKSPGERFQSMTELRSALEGVRSRALSSESFAEIEEFPRRGRLRIVLGGLGVIAAGVAVAMFALRTGSPPSRPPRPDAKAFVPSSVVDAAAPVSPDADSIQSLDAAIEDSLSVTVRADRYVVDARVTPRLLRAAMPATLSVTLAELDDAAQHAHREGKLEVRITITHFAHHDAVAQQTLLVDEHDSVALDWTPRAGRHHVTVEPRANGRSLGRSRFDVVAE